MSYRDSASAIYNVGKDELNYGIENNKAVFLSVETYSTEGDNISFYEEGKEYMLSELKKLREMLPKNSGIAIHQIKSWKDLDE